jgi:autotransporter-associated beta strand protein
MALLALSLAFITSVPAQAAERVWDGSARGDGWNDIGNWVGLGVPAAGDSLLFPVGALKPSNNNDFPAGTVFNVLTYTGAGYTASGNEIGLTGGIVVSHGAGNTILILPISVAASQTFDVSLAGATLFLNGAVDLGGIRTVLTFDGAGQTIVSGNISDGRVLIGGGGIRKNGSGTLYVLQNLTLRGSTVVNGGTLIMDGRMSNSAVTVNASATLRGTGKVGGLTVNSGGTVGPGLTSPDILDSLGDVALNAGSILNIRLNGTSAGLNYDQLRVQGTVTLGGTLNVTAGFAAAIGDTFTIIDNDGTEAVSGMLNGLPEGAEFLIGSESFRISYVGGTGNDVVLTRGKTLWPFSIIAGVSQSTVSHYGNLATVGAMISNQIATVNQRFNDPGVFDGYFKFVVTSVYAFNGDPVDEIAVAHPNHDFKIVYDGYPAQGGGWYGNHLTIWQHGHGRDRA